MANVSGAVPQTLRQFAFPTHVQSSKYVLTVLAALSVCLLWRESYRVAIGSVSILAIAYISDRNAVVEGRK